MNKRNRKGLVKFLKEKLQLKINYVYCNDTEFPYIEFRLILDGETIDYNYIYTRPENRELGSLISMYVAHKNHGMEVQAESVKQRILEMLNAENQKEFKKIISDNSKKL